MMSSITSTNASNLNIAVPNSIDSAEYGELNLLIYLDSTSTVTEDSISDFIGLCNTTMGSITVLNNPTGQTSALNAQLLEDLTDLPAFDAVIIFGTSHNITQSGAKTTIERTLARGGGIILAGTSGETEINTNLNTLLVDYGLELGLEETTSNSTLVPEPYNLVRNFAPRYLPFVENVSQIIYHGVNVTINDTLQHAEDEDQTEILYSYPLLYSGEETLIEPRELLGTVTEFSGRGRLITIGSSYFFNDTVIRTLEEETSEEVLLQGYLDQNVSISVCDNWLLTKNLINWVAGVSGTLKFSDPVIGGYYVEKQQDHVFHAIDHGDSIWGAVNLTTADNSTVSHAEVTLFLRMLETPLVSTIMEEVNVQQFNGSFGTKTIDEERGWATIGFKAQAIGYGRIILEDDEISRVWVKPKPFDPNLPTLGMWLVFGAGSTIFLITVAFIWKSFQEMEEKQES